CRLAGVATHPGRRLSPYTTLFRSGPVRAGLVHLVRPRRPGIVGEQRVLIGPAVVQAVTSGEAGDDVVEGGLDLGVAGFPGGHDSQPDPVEVPAVVGGSRDVARSSRTGPSAGAASRLP